MSAPRELLLGIATLAACGGEPGPCDGVADTCLAVRVASTSRAIATGPAIEQLHLDLTWIDRHATTATTPVDGGVTLPLATAIRFTEPLAAPARIDVVAGIAAGGAVIATGYATTTLVPGDATELAIDVVPRAACDVDAAYCGGVAIAGDPDTVYTCTPTIPVARGRCPGDCVTHPTLGDTCAGVGGTCVTGGLYCGGDKLDGDPSTLYECSPTGTAINPTFCDLGCVVAPAGTDDHCRT